MSLSAAASWGEAWSSQPVDAWGRPLRGRRPGGWARDRRPNLRPSKLAASKQPTSLRSAVRAGMRRRRLQYATAGECDQTRFMSKLRHQHRDASHQPGMHPCPLPVNCLSHHAAAPPHFEALSCTQAATAALRPADATLQELLPCWQRHTVHPASYKAAVQALTRWSSRALPLRFASKPAAFPACHLKSGCVRLPSCPRHPRLTHPPVSNCLGDSLAV